MRNLNSNLIKFFGIASVLGAIVGVLIYKFNPLFSHDTIYYCRSFLTGSLINVPPIVHTILITIFLFFIAAIFAKIIFVFIKAYRFRKVLNKRYLINNDLNPILKKLGLIGRVNVIEDSKLFAFCLGIRNPMIYVSTKTIEMMNQKELEAILLHEKYHLHKKDGLIMLIASVTKLIFPFFPLISDLIERYRLDREVKADKEVVARIGKRPLVSVLEKLLLFPSVPMLTASAIAEMDTIESRIRALSHNKNTKIRYKKLNVLISLVSLILLVSFIGVPVQATEIHTKDNDTVMVCVNDDKCAELCKENAHAINQRINYSIENTSYPYTPVR